MCLHCGVYGARQTLNKQWKIWWTKCYISYKNTPYSTLYVPASHNKLYCFLNAPWSLSLWALHILFPCISHLGTLVLPLLTFHHPPPSQLNLCCFALTKISIFFQYCPLLWAPKAHCASTIFISTACKYLLPDYILQEGRLASGLFLCQTHNRCSLNESWVNKWMNVNWLNRESAVGF